MTNYKNYEIVEKNNRYQTRLKEKIWKINDKTPKPHCRPNAAIVFYSVKSPHVKKQQQSTYVFIPTFISTHTGLTEIKVASDPL